MKKNTTTSKQNRCVSRRDLLFGAGEGISGLALAYLLNRDGLLAAETAPGPASCANSAGIPSPFSAKAPHFKPRAKSVISLFMDGGVSAIDTFNPKPALDKYHGQPLPVKGEVQVQQGFPGPIMRSPYKFKRYGQSGIAVSELFPHMATCVDDIALIQSAQGRSNDHSISHFEWTSGSLLTGFPTRGPGLHTDSGPKTRTFPRSWSFMITAAPYNGPSNWGAGFLPASYQGTVFRSMGDPFWI